MSHLVPIDADGELWVDPARVIAVDEDTMQNTSPVRYVTTVIIDAGHTPIRWAVDASAADIVGRLNV